MKKLLACVIAFASITPAFAVEVRELKSNDGYLIQLSYDLVDVNNNGNRPIITTVAKPLTITVTGPGITETTPVQVLFMNTKYKQPQCVGVPGNKIKQDQFRIDLKYDDKKKAQSGELYTSGFMRFEDANKNVSWVPLSTAKNDPSKYDPYPGVFTIAKGYCFTTYTDLEVAAVADGKWIKNGDQNFKVKLQ